MEQLVILLLIALISIINWIIQKSKEAREKRKLEKRADATGEPVAKHEPAPDATGTETAMRRLREALGLPEDAPPPAIPKRAESERVESKRIEPKRGERPAVRASALARPAGSAAASSAREKASCGARAASAALGGASQVRTSPQDCQASRYPRRRNSLLAFANFSSRKEVCAMRLSFRRFWVRRRACESVRFPHEYRASSNFGRRFRKGST